MNELKFPIKYAVLELKTNGGYSTNYEDVTVGFIVSKGYVVESKIRYTSNGKAEKSYQVVFPFNDIDAYSKSLFYKIETYHEDRKIPRLDASYNYYPVQIVSEVFDTYEEAFLAVNAKNSNLKSRIWLYYSVLDPNFKEKHEKALKKFAEKLAICKSYEDFVTENTGDMIVTKSADFEDIVRLERKKETK